MIKYFFFPVLSVAILLGVFGIPQPFAPRVQQRMVALISDVQCEGMNIPDCIDSVDRGLAEWRKSWPLWRGWMLYYKVQDCHLAGRAYLVEKKKNMSVSPQRFTDCLGEAYALYKAYPKPAAPS